MPIADTKLLTRIRRLAAPGSDSLADAELVATPPSAEIRDQLGCPMPISAGEDIRALFS